MSVSYNNGDTQRRTSFDDVKLVVLSVIGSWDTTDTQKTLWQNYSYITITYASPSWRGFVKAEEIARLKAIVFKARRYGYLPTDSLSLDDLLDACDESLFTSTRYNPQHVLQPSE